MKPVKSSTIKAIGYDPDTLALDVEFINGGLYRYENVSPEAYAALENAESIGSHLQKQIKGKYAFKKLDPSAAPEVKKL